MAEPSTDAAPWIAALEADEACPERQEWLKRARKINDLYRRKARVSRRRFALFWSNIATLQPAVYARTPKCVVTRRWKTADPVARAATEVLERAVNFSTETEDFASVMTQVRDEYLLIAQGVGWVRYVPQFQGDDDTAAVAWEDVHTDHVAFDDFGHNVAREWSEVTRVWRRAFLSRADLVSRFGRETGNRVPLDWSPKGKEGSEDETGKKAAIYEIWDLPTRQRIMVSKGLPEVLEAKPDPLKLTGFFPCPKPALGTLGLENLTPVPDFVYYQDQVEEVDELTDRIDKLTDAMRVRGFYAASEGQNLDQLMKSGDNTLIPVDSWVALRDSGGMKGVIDWFPVEQVAAVLKGCFEARKQIVEDVYQVTGISDIMRGDTDPDETAKAQGLKSQWGSARVRDRQKELQRFARDVFRLKAQIIASRFGQDTLAKMTGVELLTAAELKQVQAYQQAAQAAQQAPQPGAPTPLPPPPPPFPPAKMQLASQPTWEDVMGVLRDPVERAFRIDVETDSTIEPNDAEQKARAVEFGTFIMEAMTKGADVLALAPQAAPLVAETIKTVARTFRFERELEPIIDQVFDQIAGMPPQQQGDQGKPQPNPQVEQAKAQAAQTSAQAAVITAQARAQDAQTGAFEAQSKHQIGMAQVRAENARTASDHVLAQQDQRQQIVERAQVRRETAEINSHAPLGAPAQR